MRFRCRFRQAAGRPPIERRHRLGMTEKDHEKFEQQIERIHQLLEDEPSHVTWNDRRPDPDNPSQLRQIDITIQRNGRTTHVECRLHKAPQDVQWIEELIGRRISLRADAVIAVSSSGFTDGAVIKARHFDIALRSLQKLSDEEIRIWGQATSAKVIFYEFTKIVIAFTLPPVPQEELRKPRTVTNEDGSPVNWRAVFDAAMKEFDGDNELDTQPKHFDAEIHGSFLINGTLRPMKTELSATVRRVTRDLALSDVLDYSSIGDASIARVSRHESGSLEILSSTDEEAAFVTDMSRLLPPPNCFLHCVWMDAGRPVYWKLAKIIEAQQSLAFNGSPTFRFRFPISG